MIKFKVNEYITVTDETFDPSIYINDKFFDCKGMHLILVPKNRSSYIENIQSVDNVYNELVGGMEEYEFESLYEGEISYDEHFWGCCSNLQAWAENDYNTDLLYHELAFPLLKKLVFAGDPLAKKVIRKEVVRRYIYGPRTTRRYLFENGYIYLIDESYESYKKEIANTSRFSELLLEKELFRYLPIRDPDPEFKEFLKKHFLE